MTDIVLDRDAAAGVQADPPAEALLSREDLMLIGSTIGGESNWQADVGRQVGYSKSTMTRYLNASRHTTTMLARGLKRVIIDKIGRLTTMLVIHGMPHAEDADTLKAQALILEGLEVLKAQDRRDDEARRAARGEG